MTDTELAVFVTSFPFVPMLLQSASVWSTVCLQFYCCLHIVTECPCQSIVILSGSVSVVRSEWSTLLCVCVFIFRSIQQYLSPLIKSSVVYSFVFLYPVVNMMLFFFFHHM
ncbi:unnamed protein product [Candidula unifasciata]|uniref:Uncharacterized protein n=1 Tax=Candidula unifasciata TaxID=100452 RepID=A0A8S3Z8J0_9EUPU|nr:unnamed protein product [Candidula unifasciata]